MDKQALEAKEMVKNLPFKEKVKHFWEYYRNHTLVAAFALAVIIFGLVQCVTQVEYDLSIAYYSTKGVEQTTVDAFADTLEGVIGDIDENGTTAIFMPVFLADITEQFPSEESLAMRNKIPLELAADEYQMYILDEAYMDLFNAAYSDVIQSTLLLSDIPEVSEALGFYEGEKVYLVMTVEFEQSADDEKKLKERENAALLEQYFLEKLK